MGTAERERLLLLIPQRLAHTYFAGQVTKHENQPTMQCTCPRLRIPRRQAHGRIRVRRSLVWVHHVRPARMQGIMGALQRCALPFGKTKAGKPAAVSGAPLLMVQSGDILLPNRALTRVLGRPASTCTPYWPTPACTMPHSHTMSRSPRPAVPSLIGPRTPLFHLIR